MPGAEEGADGFEKFPACSRCSSSWFELVGGTAGLVCFTAMIPRHLVMIRRHLFVVVMRPCVTSSSAALPNWYRTLKTAASPREPWPRGAVRGGRRCRLSWVGPELYGVSPGPPGFGPGVPMELPPDGLAVAPKRAPKTRARRPPPHRSKDDVSCLRSSLSVLSWTWSDDWGGCRLVEVLSFTASDGIRNASWKVRRHHRLLHGRGPLSEFRFCG